MRIYLSIIVAAISFQPASTIGATSQMIKHREYVYSYDNEARGLEEDVFLICTDCQDSRLNPIYSLSARYSVAPRVEMPSEEPYEAQQEVAAVPSKILGTIRFHFNSHSLSTSQKRKLDGLDLKRKRIRLEGYACTIGPSSYNVKLSKKRADTIAKYLKNRGVSILETIGYGESKKFKEKAMNRRVEIIEDAKE